MNTSSTAQLPGDMAQAGDSPEVEVEAFNLHYRELGRTFDYVRDADLSGVLGDEFTKHVGGGHRAGLVVVELGIDGYEAHRVRVDVGIIPPEHTDVLRYRNSGDEVRMLTDAIEAMTAIRDELARVQS